jgi:hypothetical protein
MNVAPVIPLGTHIEPYGRVAAVGWKGERVYWIVSDTGREMAMIPAVVIEKEPESKS